jgi:Domain of unknown function (DUF5666)
VKLLRLIAGCAMLMALALLVAAAQKPPAPVAAALQAPNPTQIHIEGELKSKNAGLWAVGEFSVLVDGQTQVVEKRGLADVGAWLIVWAVSDPSGTPRAEVIVVDRPAGATNPSIQLTGVLNKSTGEWWVVGDELVHAGPSASIIGAPTVGSLVTVTAVHQDLVLEAMRIETAVQDPSQIPFDFEGTIEAMEQGRWRVEDRWVTVSPSDTQILGTPEVGKHAEVRVLLQGDGSLLATLIRVPDRIEVTMGTLVTDIVPQASGTQVWDVSVFPDQLYTDPYSATVQVDGDTLVDESRAIARPGQWADVRAKSLNPDEFQAEVIRLEQTVAITVEGNLQQAATASGAGGWAQIGGRTIWFPGQMAGNVSAATGGQGKTLIEGILLGNGIVWAQRFVPIEGQTP